MSFKSAEPFDYAPFDGFEKLTAGSLRVFDRISDHQRSAISNQLFFLKPFP